MEYTEKLHLNLPGDADLPDISKLSENFRKIDEYLGGPGEPYKVGDILSTYRTDLGEDWLLCNGEPFDPEEYPDLANITPGMEAMVELTASTGYVLGTSSSSSNDYPILGSATDGSVVAICVSSSSTSSGYIYYSSDNFRTVTKVATSVSGYAIFYTNGHWIVPYSSSNGGFYETADVSGEWTKHAFTASPGNIQHIEYYDGKYWAFGASNDFSNTQSAAWYGSFLDFNITGIVKTTVSTPSQSKRCCFVRTDKFEFFCTAFDSTHFYRISADTPDGTWTTSAAIMLASGVYPFPYVRYCDGFIYGVCCTVQYNSSAEKNYVMKIGAFILDDNVTNYALMGKDISRSWPSTATMSDIAPYTYTLNYARGAIIFFKDSNGYIMPRDASQCSVVEVPDNLRYESKYGRSVVAESEVHCSALVDGSKNYTRVVSATPIYGVPKISTPQSYTYIKAKEDDPDADQQTDAPPA